MYVVDGCGGVLEVVMLGKEMFLFEYVDGLFFGYGGIYGVGVDVCFG